MIVHGTRNVFVGIKNWGFVRVVPEPGDPHIEKVFRERPPPPPHRREGKFRKDTVARPYFADIESSVGVLYEIICGQARVKRFVARDLSYVEVGNSNDTESHFAQIRNERLKTREVLAAD